MMQDSTTARAKHTHLPILIADDDRTTRDMLESLLIGWGYAPRLFPDGESAW